MRSLARIAAAALAVAIALTAAACASANTAVLHPITIVMQESDLGDPPAKYFIAQVRKRSGGRIRIVPGTAYPSSNSRNEPRLVRSVRSGKVKMAYIPSRAWEEASPVTAFRALQAPLLVTNYPLLRRITTGPIGRSMLKSLGSIGVVGLGLVPDRMRRLLGRKPLDSAASLRGARIRPVTSPTSELALKALGAVPVRIDAGRAAGPEMKSAQIDGVESETIAIENNGYLSDARDLVANLVPFAKATTIAINQSVFAHLSSKDRGILQAAAAVTVAHADPAGAERKDMLTLCPQGVKLVTATAAELASLEPLARSAFPKLEQDPTTRREIRAIEKLKDAAPSKVSSIPPCPKTHESNSVSTGNGPTGTYTVTLSRSAVANGSGGQANNWGSFRLSIGNGQFRISDHRSGGQLVQHATHGFSSGTYTIQGGKGRRITFTTHAAAGDTPLGAPHDPPIVVDWSRYKHRLTFQQLPATARAELRTQGFDPVGPPLLYASPWQQTSRAPPAGGSEFPTGTFETKITPADVRGVGPAWWAHWETLTFTKNGNYTDVWFHPRRHDQPTVNARYTARGHRLRIGNNTFAWTYYRRLLTLRIVHSDLDALGFLIFQAHPWRKIG